MQNSHRFKRNYIINSIPEKYKRRLIKHSYQVGDYVYQKGSIFDCVHFIDTGKIDVIVIGNEAKDYIHVANYSAEYLAMIEAFSDYPSYVCTIKVIEPTVTFAMKKNDLIAMLNEIPEYKDIMLNYLAGQAINNVLNVGRHAIYSTSYNLVSYLITQSDLKKDSNNLYIDRSKLADYLGVSLRTVHRQFVKLKNNNYITIVEGKIAITKRQLRELIAFRDTYIT